MDRHDVDPGNQRVCHYAYAGKRARRAHRPQASRPGALEPLAERTDSSGTDRQRHIHLLLGVAHLSAKKPTPQTGNFDYLATWHSGCVATCLDSMAISSPPDWIYNHLRPGPGPACSGIAPALVFCLSIHAERAAVPGRVGPGRRLAGPVAAADRPARCAQDVPLLPHGAILSGWRAALALLRAAIRNITHCNASHTFPLQPSESLQWLLVGRFTSRCSYTC